MTIWEFADKHWIDISSFIGIVTFFLLIHFCNRT